MIELCLHRIPVDQPCLALVNHVKLLMEILISDWTLRDHKTKSDKN